MSAPDEGAATPVGSRVPTAPVDDFGHDAGSTCFDNGGGAMARLVPEDFSTEAMLYETERHVVEALLALPDSWFILPNVRLLRYDVERELDIVLLHPRLGVVLVEVKGFIPEVRRGIWRDEYGREVKSPIGQAMSNSYNLRARLTELWGTDGPARVPFAVAFPRAGTFDGTLPEDREEFHVLVSTDLADADLLEEKIVALASSTYLLNGFDEEMVNAIIDAVAPDAKFTWDAEGEHRRARNMLRKLSTQQVEGFASLDANRQVFVQGRAGTGKTRLARSWVRRAADDRHERVLLTCYNDPLGWSFRDDFEGNNNVTAAPFLQLLLGYVGLDAPPPGVDLNTWWNETLPDDAARAIAENGQRFDTVVIDEVQDFAPRWLKIAQMLLDPDGPRRMLLLGDEAQDIYDRGFEAPSVDDGWVHATMPRNCRNADIIARLLRRKLDGALPSPAAPPGWQCRFVSVADPEAMSATVGTLLNDLINESSRNPGSIGVVATSAALRNRLAIDHGLTQDPDGKSTCVGTPHRLKGLEFDTVILAVPDPNPTDVALYIGVSRAISELIIVGPQNVGLRLGLPLMATV
jgi:hypothetical protein